MTRLFGQLKMEGVLGTIWGSKTIIEPTQVDNDIRLKAMIALPVPRQMFSVVSTYRLFVREVQRALWRQRFASQIVFYDENVLEGCTVAEALLETGANIVVWLMPPKRMWNSFARLKDRGVRPIVITDEMPSNGESGYYLSWQDAVAEGLAIWKDTVSRVALVVNESNANCSSAQRLMQSCLAEAGVVFDLLEWKAPGIQAPLLHSNLDNCGVVFLSAQSLMQFAQAGVASLEKFLDRHRVFFIHGGVDLPFQSQISGCFDTVTFDWAMIARRVVTDLIAGRCASHVETQTIFKAKWNPASRSVAHH